MLLSIILLSDVSKFSVFIIKGTLALYRTIVLYMQMNSVYLIYMLPAPGASRSLPLSIQPEQQIVR